MLPEWSGWVSLAGVTDNVFLIGPMGSGKTAVGKQLARALKVPFLDSDHAIEERTGVDIPLIFDKEGEAGFRQRESDVIADLTARRGIVLSTGGGAVLRPENRRMLRERGTVVYLETSVRQQLLRVRRGENRPLLATATDLGARLQELMNQRSQLYADTAHFTVRTDGNRVQAVVREILQKLAGSTQSAGV